MRLLCEAHKRLMRGVRGAEKQPGQIRTSQNWIGGTRPGNARFVPPPAMKYQRRWPRSTVVRFPVVLGPSSPALLPAAWVMGNLSPWIVRRGEGSKNWGADFCRERYARA